MSKKVAFNENIDYEVSQSIAHSMLESLGVLSRPSIYLDVDDCKP